MSDEVEIERLKLERARVEQETKVKLAEQETEKERLKLERAKLALEAKKLETSQLTAKIKMAQIDASSSATLDSFGELYGCHPWVCTGRCLGRCFCMTMLKCTIWSCNKI